MDNRENPSKPSYLTEYRRIGDIFGNKSFTKEKSPVDKFLYQTFISIAALAFILLINSTGLGISKTITRSIKSTLNWQVDFNKFEKVISVLNIVEEENKNDISGDMGFSENTKNIIMPLDGEITSYFGDRIHPVFNTVKKHNGIDIYGDYGVEIKSSIDGKVIELGEDLDLGKFVKISNDVYDTLYGHCSKIIVKEGQKVNQGDKIAEVGDTGYTSGPHLHFEIWVEGKAVNPLDIVGQQL